MPFLAENRVSSLTASADCQRRWAATSFPLQIEEQTGITFDYHKDNLLAHIGTAHHAGLKVAMDQKIAGQKLDLKTIALEVKNVFEADSDVDYEAEAEENKKVNIEGIRKATLKKFERTIPAMYRHAETLEPIASEFEVVGQLGEFLFTGHLDFYGKRFEKRNYVRDFKTSSRTKLPKGHHYQLAGYVRLAEHNGFEVEGAAIDHLFLAGARTEQPEVVIEEYNLKDIDDNLDFLLETNAIAFARFMETGRPEVFTANTDSMLCSKKYCPAYGTAFCTLRK